MPQNQKTNMVMSTALSTSFEFLNSSIKESLFYMMIHLKYIKKKKKMYQIRSAKFFYYFLLQKLLSIIKIMIIIIKILMIVGLLDFLIIVLYILSGKL